MSKFAYQGSYIIFACIYSVKVSSEASEAKS